MAQRVPPEGPLDAELVLVGRDPGWQEMARGRPFVGAAGHILNEALEEAQLKRPDCLITNVVDTRPARDDWSLHNAQDVLEGTEELWRLLRKYPRKVVVTLGAEAFWACVQEQAPPTAPGVLPAWLYQNFGGSITELRGYGWHSACGLVLPAIHPAFISRTWLPWRATLTWDLQKARRLLTRSVPLRHSRYATSALEASMVAAKLHGAELLAVDSEEGADGCVSFSATPEEGWTIPLTYLAPIQDLLRCPARKLFQNAQYDLTRFRKLGLEIAGQVEDLMLLWHATEPLIAGKADAGSKASQKSLRFLASVFTDEPWWKDYGFQTAEDKWRLCATDARVTLECWQALLRR